MKYRSRIEIVREMLSFMASHSNESLAKTAIMYKAYLSYAQLKEYLALLVESDLVKQVDDGRYQITPKGIEYVQLANKLDEIVPEIKRTAYDDDEGVKVAGYERQNRQSKEAKS